MIDIVKDNKTNTTTIVEYRTDANGEVVATQVSVTKKKVKTAKADLESTQIVARPSSTPLDEIATLVSIAEVAR